MRLEPTSHTEEGDKKKDTKEICMKNGIIKDNRNVDNSTFTRGNPTKVHPKQIKNTRPRRG